MRYGKKNIKKKKEKENVVENIGWNRRNWKVKNKESTQRKKK